MYFSIQSAQLGKDGSLYILRGHKMYFPKLFFSVKIDCVLAINADVEERADCFA